MNLENIMLWMKLESMMLSEISQAVRDKYHMISPLTRTQSTKEKSKKKVLMSGMEIVDTDFWISKRISP